MLFAMCAAMCAMLQPGKLPPPLAPADGAHTFTYDSVQRRLPLIVEAVLDNNPEFPEGVVTGLRTLAAEIARGAPLLPLPLGAPQRDPTMQAARKQAQKLCVR